MICPFCKKPAVWTANQAIYGKNYGKSFMMWLCKPCNAYVGCHNNTRKALGTMADHATREWRKKAHAAFDPWWKTGRISRNRAYARLKRHFGHEVHIGESDILKCQLIIAHVESFNDTKTHAPASRSNQSNQIQTVQR